MRIVALILTICLIAGAGLTGAATAQDRQISVSATGEIEVVPDMATISLGVVTEARLAADALAQNSKRAAVVIETLKAAGIDAADIQTSRLDLSPKWNRTSNTTEPRIVGYAAQNQVTVRLRDLSVLGAVLDRVTGDGANQFRGLQFGLQDSSAVEDQALAAAVVTARAKAEVMANAAGVALGPVISMSYGQVRGPVMPAMRADLAVMSEAVPVAEGSLTVSASVGMTFSIGD